MTARNPEVAARRARREAVIREGRAQGRTAKQIVRMAASRGVLKTS